MHPNAALIEVFGCDGSYFCIQGPDMQEGAQGVGLSQSAKGFWDAPVKTVYDRAAFQRGATFRGRQWLQRDLTFSVDLLADTPEGIWAVKSAWSKAWDFELDPWDDDAKLTEIRFTTPESGSRSVWAAKSQEVQLAPAQDVRMMQWVTVPMTATAGQPFWDSGEEMTFWQTGATSDSGYITVSNPTDVPMYQKWVCTLGTWTLPDVSWKGRKYHRGPGGADANRKVPLPALTPANGGATVDLDPMHLMVRDNNRTNLIGQMNGQFFNYIIPPYTPETQLPVSVTGAPAGGARVELHQPRLWSEPMGLE